MNEPNLKIKTHTPPNISAPEMTYEEFLRKYEGQYAEYVGSKVIVNMTVTETHNRLTNFLSTLMQVFVEQKKLGKIYGEPYQMKMEIDGEIRGREPDIFFVKTENTERIGEQYFEGGADLVVEVVSPESVNRDTQEKFREYEKAGVEEYWLIDYSRRTAKFYGFDKNRKYKLLPISPEGKFKSRVIEKMWIDTNWFWQKELPNLIDVLKEWNLV